jgi:hypothetical protein
VATLTETARDAVLDLAANGERLTHAQVKEIRYTRPLPAW